MDGGGVEVLGFGCVDVHELLRVAVHEREPGGLDLYHEAVAFAEGMEDVGQLVGGVFRLEGRQRGRSGVAVAEVGAEDFGAYQHLAACELAGSVVGEDVDDLDDEVGVGGGGGDVEVGGDRADEGEIGGEGRRLVGKNVCAG